MPFIVDLSYLTLASTEHPERGLSSSAAATQGVITITAIRMSGPNCEVATAEVFRKVARASLTLHVASGDR